MCKGGEMEYETHLTQSNMIMNGARKPSKIDQLNASVCVLVGYWRASKEELEEKKKPT